MGGGKRWPAASLAEASRSTSAEFMNRSAAQAGVRLVLCTTAAGGGATVASSENAAKQGLWIHVRSAKTTKTKSTQ